MSKPEEFQNYNKDKWFWFSAYLQLGAAISLDPNLSAKCSNFSDLLQEHIDNLQYEEELRRMRGHYFGSNDSK